MDFALTGEQEMLKSLVERFIAQRYPAQAYAAARALPTGYQAENWALLAELGLAALPFAEAHGGMAGGDIEIVTAMEAFGRGPVAEPVLDEIVIAGRLLEIAGTTEQASGWLPDIIGGRAHAALAQAEHGTRFDLSRAATRFEQGRLIGGKTCVPGGADVYIVTAQGAHGFCLALADADAPGLRRRDYRLVDGSVASELAFDATPAAPMAGGLAELEAVAQSARMAACAEMVGIAGLIFDLTLDYVRQRKQFGSPIGSFQAIQHRLADLYTCLELARSQLLRCVLAEPARRDSAIAAAKSYISNVAVTLGETCIQFHGGMGVSDELLIGHAHKRILRLANLFGDPEFEMLRYDRARKKEALLF